MAGGGGSGEARRAREAEEKRQAEIRKGTSRINKTFGQFDDDFFADRRQSYMDFARPQVDDAYGDATEKLTYALARNGTLNSSVAGDQNADLNKEYQINLQDIADRARGYETEARNQIEGARADLITTLQATGDASGAANSAVNRAAALSQQPAYSPIGQLFTDFTSGLSQQAALERAEAAGSPVKPRYNTGLFGVPAGAVRTT